MALKPCHECGKEVSTEAKSCPHCGAKPRQTSLVTWLVAIIGGFMIFGWLGGTFKGPGGPSPYQLELQAQAAALGALKLEKYSWQKGGFDNILIATFTLRNTGTRAVKDIQITCTSHGNSGTQIDTNKRVIYETIQPGQRLRVKDFNMGFQHTQAARAGCEVTDLALL